MANEKRLIDATVLCSAIECVQKHLIAGDSDFFKGYLGAMEGMLNATNEMPTVDAVEVVRCKDCRGKNGGVTGPEGRYLCERTSRWVRDNDFCSYGERRKENA